MYDNERQSIIYNIKMFFEGDNYKGIEPVMPMPTNQFEISKFAFNETRDTIDLRVFIGNPGPFIGPKGDTVQKLHLYLNMGRQGKKEIRIMIHQKNVWKI